jgi:hypothetical protein
MNSFSADQLTAATASDLPSVVDDTRKCPDVGTGLQPTCSESQEIGHENGRYGRLREPTRRVRRGPCVYSQEIWSKMGRSTKFPLLGQARPDLQDPPQV